MTSRAARVRSRRALSIEQPTEQSTEEERRAQARQRAIDLGRDLIRASKERNRIDGRIRSMTKRMTREMADAGFETTDELLFEVSVDQPDGTVLIVPAEAVYQTQKEEVDVVELSRLVDSETLLAIVKATKGAVKDRAGTVVLNRVLKTVATEPELKVRERK